LENYKTKIVDSLAKNLLENKESVDYPSLEEQNFNEKFSHVGNYVATFKSIEQAGTVETQFNQYDEATTKITPIKISELIAQKFRAKFIILVEGIFVSSTAISIQAKIVQALVIPNKRKKLTKFRIEV
jgi:hypothetical protein